MHNNELLITLALISLHKYAEVVFGRHLHLCYIISVVPPCELVDILTRTNDKPSIDSTNPTDNPNLTSGDGSTWVSSPPASINVTFPKLERVMQVVVETVSGTKQVSVIFESKDGTTLKQVDVDTSKVVSI